MGSKFKTQSIYKCLVLKCNNVLNSIFNTFRLPEETDVAAFDDESASVIRLNNSTVLYMREINKVLALVCILREENFTKPGKHSVYRAGVSGGSSGSMELLDF